ncbi:MAG: hypothetical protein ACREM2_04905 [Vulcanimicrobiaceae bacterium]
MLHPEPPIFPGTAVVSRVAGKIDVEIAIDEAGLIRSATIVKSDFTTADWARPEPAIAAAEEALNDVSLLAAVSSTYAPKIRDCSAVAGIYIFRAEYILR